MPGEDLPGEEGYAESEREVEPRPGGGEVCGMFAARDYENQAAGKNYQGVQIKDGGESDVTPVVRGLPNDQGTGEGRERHGDGGDGNPDSAESRSGRLRSAIRL